VTEPEPSEPEATSSNEAPVQAKEAR
jgi:hypothetical protein